MFLNKDHSCRTSFLYHLVEALIVKLKAPLISRSWNLLSTCVSRPVLWGWMTYNEQTFVGRAFAHLYCSHLGPDQQVCAVQIIIQTMFLFIYFFFEEERERISVLHLGIQLSLGSASLLLPQHFLDILPSPFHLFLMVGVEDSKSFGISEVLKEARQEFTSWKKLQCGQNNHYLNPKSLTTDQVHRTFCLVALPQIAFLKVVITMSTLPSAIGTRSRNWLKTCPS